ncbi:MAG: GAF domain-containing protein [Bacteroidetes bacterium]|nr:GAF domain-containing protein [Bacteroidota bacterium]
MSKNALLKILSIIAFLASLLVVFMLFAKVRNISVSYNLGSEQNGLYVLLTFSLLLSLALLIITLMLSTKQNSDEKYSQQNAFDLEGEKKEKKLDEDYSEEEKLDADYYISKIIPKHNAKIDITKYTEKILSNIAKEFDIVQGLFFVKAKDSDEFNITGKYAYFGEEEPKSFTLGETLSGQVAKNQKVLNLKEIPENYITILSGLGSSSPNHLIIIPVVIENTTVAIIELASFKEFKGNFKELFQTISEKIGNELLKY